MESMLFDGWMSLVRTAMVGFLAYCLLVILLRVAGKRTLAKMNAFDWVVTVALGSTLATILLNEEVSLAQGALALVLLVGMQFVVTWSGVRAQWVHTLVAAEPSLVFYQGEFQRVTMRRERVSDSDVLAAVRATGQGSLGSIAAVVLETDGSFSVLPTATDWSEPTSLQGTDATTVIGSNPR